VERLINGKGGRKKREPLKSRSKREAKKKDFPAFENSKRQREKDREDERGCGC